MVKFYIIIPVYKTEKYIRQCIESVLNQAYNYYDVILVDDGSPDKAGIICDEYASKNGHIHVIHKKNEGPLSARQAGIRYAEHHFDDKNAFFIFLDSDDALKSTALAIVEKIISRTNCDLVIYGVERVCNGIVVGANREPTFEGVITDKRELCRKIFCNSTYNSMCKKAIKCNLLQSVDYNELAHINRGEDLLQSIPVIKKCKKAVFLSEALYEYTVNPESITQSISYETYRVNSTVYKTVWEFLNTENVFTEDDRIEYLDFCCKLLKEELKTVGNLKTNRENMEELFDEICCDDFYSRIIESSSKDILITWLRRRQYFKLICFIRGRIRLGKLYHFWKRKFKIEQ